MFNHPVYEETEHTLRVSGSSETGALRGAIIAHLIEKEMCDITFMGPAPCWTAMLAVCEAQREMKKIKRKAVMESFRVNFRISRKNDKQGKPSFYQEQHVEIVGEVDGVGNQLYGKLIKFDEDKARVVVYGEETERELPSEGIIPVGHGIVIKMRLLKKLDSRKSSSLQ